MLSIFMNVIKLYLPFLNKKLKPCENECYRRKYE